MAAWLTRNVRVLAAVSFLQDTASELLYPLLPIYLTTVLGAPPAVVGAIEGAAEGAASITKLAIGPLGDRYAKRPLIATGYGMAALGKVIVAVAGAWPGVLAGRVVDRLGKTASTSEDFPAFIVNRILMPMINEAVYTLYEGVGSVKSIDEAMKLGANHPMGPLELADFIGLDTCLAIMNVLHDGLADTKYRPCPLLTKYVEAGWLGRKTQRGFYDYRGETPVPTR